MAQVCRGKGEEKVIFLVAYEDVVEVIKKFALPIFINEGNCLIIYYSAQELLEGMFSWNLYSKRYGEPEFLFLIDTRIDGIVALSNFLKTCREHIIVKSIQPILDKLEAAGYIKSVNLQD